LNGNFGSWDPVCLQTSGELATVAMKLSGRMTLGALLPALGKMNIRLVICFGAGKFAKNPSAVATDAHCFHGWLSKPVSGQKSAFGIRRQADMALAATGMALSAMAIESLFNERAKNSKYNLTVFYKKRAACGQGNRWTGVFLKIRWKEIGWTV
jgi:hypothetical protein